MKLYEVRVGKEHDKRRKLTDEQREEIKRLYENKDYSLQRLAIKFHVCRDTIYRIVNPNAEKLRKGYSEKHWRKYKPSQEKSQQTREKHFQYKQSLVDNGMI